MKTLFLTDGVKCERDSLQVRSNMMAERVYSPPGCPFSPSRLEGMASLGQKSDPRAKELKAN
jgi:hypothetical protein